MVLAQDGDVGDDVHGRDVSREDDDAAADDVGSAGGGLAQGLDDLLDTSLEGLVLCGCWGVRLCFNRKEEWVDCTYPS